MPLSVLIVGAGFAGAVHARLLAEAGVAVTLIDKRDHLGGNAYDEVLACGTRVHRYGPHLFHTSNARVVAWLRRFSAFVDHQHRVQAQLPDGRCVPLPINRTTMAALAGRPLPTAQAAQDWLAAQASAARQAGPASAASHLAGQIGDQLSELFFARYSRKMWGIGLEELHPSVVQRIPLRFDEDDRYFQHRYQLLPAAGYAALFQALLDHPGITCSLRTTFAPAMRAGFDHCFASLPIDEHYDYRLGLLPYRSIRFHHRLEPEGFARGSAATINFTDHSRFTRETDWSRLPGHRPRPGPLRTITREEPCADHENGMERYYPVRTSDDRHQHTYRRYVALARQDPGISFIGRCGTYRYLDMDQVINQSMASARAWLHRQGLGPGGRPGSR